MSTATKKDKCTCGSTHGDAHQINCASIAPTKTIFEKLNATFKDLPILTGDKVFTTAEYAEAIGLNRRSVRERLAQLKADGKVRRVRSRRDGNIVPAWEYVGR